MHALNRAVLVSLATLMFTAPAFAGDKEKDGCPKPDKKATTEQVVQARLAALLAGDFDRVVCFYAKDATVIMPGQVLQGRDVIGPAFLAFGQFLGGAPVITAVTTSGAVSQVTYTLDGPTVSVPDGSDTFVVKDGLVQYQTVHASIVFHSP